MCNFNCLLLLLYLAPSSLAVYYDYERQQRYQVNAYDWAYEEVPSYLKEKRPRKANFGYWSLTEGAKPWAVGIRGRYSSEKYLFQRCMGILVQKYYVITFCSCVCTWYATNRIDEARVGVGVVHTPSTCDKNYDIRSGKLYVFLQFESSNGKGIATESFEVSTFDVPSSPNCDAAIDGERITLKLYVSFVILVLNKVEVDTVLSGPNTYMNPPWPPSDYTSSMIYLNITSYGAQLRGAIIEDKEGQPFSLEHHPISVLVKENPSPYTCGKYSSTEDFGLCFSVSLLEVCGLLAGSPLIGYNKESKSVELIGLVQNHMSCYDRQSTLAPVHVIPLSRVMARWTAFEESEATEKAQYDVQELPWDDKTTPTYFDMFPPDSLKNLSLRELVDINKSLRLSQAPRKEESILVIFSLSVLIQNSFI